jgi:sterol desaturase/sphingolipid hydroxylase (fatty acid hydroxylase superfamily)
MWTDIAWREVQTFFNLQLWVGMWQANDYSPLGTFEGFLAAALVALPLAALFEVGRLVWRRELDASVLKVAVVTYALNRTLGSTMSIAGVAFAVGLLSNLAPFSVGVSWLGFLYAYVVYELGHYLFHFSAHKVRLLWCLHSPHHAPENMSLLVNYNRFFFEGFYVWSVRTGTCMLLGVSPPLFALVLGVDRIWGYIVHLGPNALRDARLGWLEHIILTPSHHRVHHAKNPAYMDTNFCNLLSIWDRLFGTYQRELRDVPIEYGITRPVRTNSFLDTYFGELALLARDVWRAPGLKNKVLYIFMPPGWSHTGAHSTASAIRRAYFKEANTRTAVATANT